jgi:membrane protease YdiL (CAAX protease family)
MPAPRNARSIAGWSACRTGLMSPTLEGYTRSSRSSAQSPNPSDWTAGSGSSRTAGHPCAARAMHCGFPHSGYGIPVVLIVNEAISAGVNLVVLVMLPFAVYLAYHKWRHKRSLGEIVERTGLTFVVSRHLAYCAALAVVAVVALLLLPVEPFVREGSAHRSFAGLPLGTAIPIALLYGVVQTGFAEEFFFRGLVAGSLSRRLPFWWANVGQAVIFLLPHLLLLLIMPEMWPVLVVVFASSLFVGWVRIDSGSILGPWLLHACVNVAMAINIAVRAPVPEA